LFATSDLIELRVLPEVDLRKVTRVIKRRHHVHPFARTAPGPLASGGTDGLAWLLARIVPVHGAGGAETFLPRGSRTCGLRGLRMCLDCGCGEPNERHGDDRHITMDDVKAAAQASEISVDEAARNIADSVRQAQAAGSAD
jgi:hypothetical protein